MSRNQHSVGFLAASLLASVSCRDVTAPQFDGDPITDHWILTATFTSYTHDGGYQPGSFSEHYPATDSIAGPTLTGVLTIGNRDVWRGDSTHYSQVSGDLVSHWCVVPDAAGGCAEYGSGKPVHLPSGSVTAQASFPDAGSISGQLEIQLDTGQPWTSLHLRNVTLDGDSLAGEIQWAVSPVMVAVQPRYNGRFVAHRRR
jgi:hypothetical protein